MHKKDGKGQSPDISIKRVLSDKVEVLSTVDGHIVAGRQGNQIATAFHPELDEATRLHEFFLGLSR